MKKTVFLLILVLAAGNAGAAWLSDETVFGLSFGYSIPAGGGEWDKQYGSAPAFSLNAEKAADEEHSFGLEAGYDAGHEHDKVTACAPRVVYFTPYYKETKMVGSTLLYGTLGAGLYHRWTPAYTDNITGAKYSTSWSGKFGGNAALGAIFGLGGDYTLNAGVKFHFIRRFVGINGEMENAMNIMPVITLTKLF